MLKRLNLSLLLFLAVLGLSVVFSVDPYWSFFNGLERMSGYLIYLNLGVWYLFLTLSRKHLPAFLKFSAVVGGIVALGAIWQYFCGAFFQLANPFNYCSWVQDRPTAFIGNPAFLGAYLWLSLGLTCLLALKQRFWYFLVGLDLLAVYVCRIRGLYLGIFSGLIIFLILWLKEKRK